MPRFTTDPVDLAGVVLPEASSGSPCDLGALAGPAVVVAVRHRY